MKTRHTRATLAIMIFLTSLRLQVRGLDRDEDAVEVEESQLRRLLSVQPTLIGLDSSYQTYGQRFCKAFPTKEKLESCLWPDSNAPF